MSNLNANQKRCARIWPDEAVSYTNASVSGILSFVTIIGNLLVLVVFFKNPNGKMRTPFNWFILNLAFADLLVGAVVEPLSVLVHVREGLGKSIKYDVYLRPVYFTSCTASVFSLGMLTIDRHIAITSPMKYRATLSNKRAAISCLVIWIISCGLPFLREEIGFLWYFFVFGNASVLVTFVVLVFAFVRVHLALRAQIAELKLMQSGNEENQARNNALKTEAKITKIFMYMLIAFIFCYTPSLVMIYLMNLCTVCSCQTIHWFRDLSFIFIVLNSGVNPFLYAWRLPNFREAIKSLIKQNPRAPAIPGQRSQMSTALSSDQYSERKQRNQRISSRATTTTTLGNEVNNVVLPSVGNRGKNNSAYLNDVIIYVENEM